MFSRLFAELLATPALDFNFGATVLCLLGSCDLHYDTIMEITSRICDRYLAHDKANVSVAV